MPRENEKARLVLGAFKGTVQYTRFFVDGERPSDWIGQYEAALSLRRFVPLHEDGNDFESSGFALAQNPYFDEAPLLNNRFVFDGRIVLAYRMDKIKLPKSYIKELLARRVEEQRKKLGDEPSRNTVKALEEAVIYEVRRRVFPKSQIVDFCWDTNSNELRLFGRGKSLIENFTKLFEQTFSMKIRQMTFAERAASAQLSLQDRGQLESLVPQELYQPKVVV